MLEIPETIIISKQLNKVIKGKRIKEAVAASAKSDEQRRELFDSIKSTLSAMLEGGGRDTERDLFGVQGGYKTKLSANNKTLTCPDCGGAVKKEAYLGGSIYYCTYCQKL